MVKIVVATSNKNKIREINEIFAQEQLQGWELVSIGDFPGYEEPVEDGDSFTANALIKANAAARHTGLMALADDSGLAVDALDGAPGIYSARYAGAGHNDAANRVKLLQELAQVPDEQRGARFVCAAALVYPYEQRDGSFGSWTAEGKCEGRIAWAEKGEGGFGYDSLFYLPQYDRTMAEISAEEKNAISHRGAAFRQAAMVLRFMSDNSLDF